MEFVFIAAAVIVGIACSIYGVIAARKRREGVFELAQRLIEIRSRLPGYLFTQNT